MAKQKDAWSIDICRHGGYGFYFIKPQPNTNAKEVASQLLGLKGVEEVQITSGDFGYVIKAKNDIDELRNLRGFVGKALQGHKAVEVHYTLRKHQLEGARA
ncbi:MAG: hypothetical protein ACP5RF_00460 [Candidatus Micrarchaeia archaeon]